MLDSPRLRERSALVVSKASNQSMRAPLATTGDPPVMTNQSLRVTGPALAEAPFVLTQEALAFVARLVERFEGARAEVLDQRRERAARVASGQASLSSPGGEGPGSWQVAPAPADLNRRHVEITGPVERKMMINALNSGADVFMADLEDSLAPTWQNVVRGHHDLMAAARRTLEFSSPEGKAYRLGSELATLVVRPRGWHLFESHVRWGQEPIAASLFDFGLYFFHNARALVERGSGPYFYLPKLEGASEARLWNEVFVAAQEMLGLPQGTIRATVLIETLPAAFEMDQILYELRAHASGLNAGRWDYLFSTLKVLRDDPKLEVPDRAQLTMTVPFMRAYAQLLVKTCHQRGAHAIGGMSPFIPSRKNPEVNAQALTRVRQDKQREVGDGFDGTWVAHPGLVPVAREVFDGALGALPHQKHVRRSDLAVSAADLARIEVAGGAVTEAGVRNNISVALQYWAAWLSGTGAVAIYDLMEDAATAEICRAQLWFWVHRGAPLEDGRPVTAELYRALCAEERAALPASQGALGPANALLDRLVLSEAFVEFSTLPAYAQLSALPAE